MNELDKIFQSKLENHTAEYSEQSWDKIQSRLMEQKSKPRKFPWLWMSLFATLVIVSVVYLWSNGEESLPNTSDGDSLPVALKTDAKYNDQSTNTETETGIVIAEKVSNELKESNGKIPEETSTTFAVNTIVSNELSIRSENQSTTNENQSISKRINKTTILNTNSTVRLGSESKNNNIIENKSDLSSSITTENHQSSDAIVDNQVIKNFKSPITSSEINLLDKMVKIRPLRTIGVSAYTTLQPEKDISDISLSKSMMDDFRQDCPSFVTDRTGIYLDLYVSHELPFSSLSAKEEAVEPYAALRSNSEGPTYSYSAGARLTLMLPNGLGLKTGLNFSQVNEQFTHVNTDSDMVKEVITITTVNGMEVRDTNTVVIPGTRDIVSTNKYRSFDIPLLLSYEWDVRDRTYMTVNGGIYLNLLFKESGKILNPAGDVIDLEDSSSDKLSVFKNNIGLSLFGSVGLHYRLSSNIDLILEPNLRVLVKSATLDSYSLQHKWLTVGLITGMRYNF